MTVSRSVSETNKRLRRVGMVGLAGALVGALLAIVIGEGLSRSVFDEWQRLAPRNLSDTNVHVIVIDPASIAAAGPWPWPRYHLARLTEEIASRGAVAIGFDMIFAEPDRVRPDIFASLYPELSSAAVTELKGLKPMDQVFGEVIGRAPVVLARAGLETEGSDPADIPVESAFAGRIPADVPNYPAALANIAELDQVALGHGLINGAPDSDGIVRRLPMIATLGDQLTPGFALELARIALGLDTIEVAHGEIRLGDRRIAIDGEGQMMLRFGTYPGRMVTPAVEVMRREFPNDAFEGKVVIIGLAAEGTADIVATPLASESFGVFVHAQALDAILREEGALSRPSAITALEWAVAMVFGIVAIAWLPRARRTWLLLPALAVAIVSLSWLAFELGHLLLDPLPPLMVGVGAAAGVGLGRFAEARRERERLREQLIEERIAAAEADAELKAARDIQLGMLPPREALATLDSRLDLAALLEPARLVGGDFYDVVRISRDRVAFTIADVTGKGVPASLFMAVSKVLSKSVVLRNHDLAVAAALLNEELSRDNLNSGVTMLFGVIDLVSGEIAMVNAGHEDPIRLFADGRAEDVKMEGGPPFCVVDYPWPVETVRLLPGETLLLVTDGVTEAGGRGGALYGRLRARRAVAGVVETSACEIAKMLRNSVRVFEGDAPATDDLTVVAIRFLG